MSRPAAPKYFARLTPANYKAKHAFNEVAKTISESQSDYYYAANFMVIKPYSTPILNSAAAYDTVTDTEAVDSEAELDSDPIEFEGYYTLSFHVLPDLPLIGWIIGVGRRKNSTHPSAPVNLQLALQTQGQKYGVHSRHARLFFDDTGGLTISPIPSASPRSPEIVLGNDPLASGRRLIAQPSNHIKFGQLSYTLEFSPHEYQHDLEAFFKSSLCLDPPPPDLAGTPSPWDITVGDYIVKGKGTVGMGASDIVSAAKNARTGVAAAAKMIIMRKKSNHQKIEEEVAMLKSLPAHPRILQFLDVRYEREERWVSGPLDEEDERCYNFSEIRPEKVMIIYGPFVRATFQELFPPERTVQLMAFEQVLQGIHALHTAGFIHRDLKPANVGIKTLSSERIEIVILDYGQTVRQAACAGKLGNCGTVPYLAPEMEVTTYSNLVDVWACGIFGIRMFIHENKREPWRRIVTEERAIYKPTLAALQKNPNSSIENLLSRMIAWKPTDRISAESALKHVCFSALPPTQQDSAKRERSE